MDVKYTTDGKKVVIIGSLNSQEKIVQEVFISNGSEIPSGEHFVVKSLHNEPVVSWKESRLKEIEQQYDSKRKSLEKELELMKDKFNKSILRLRQSAIYNSLVEKSLGNKALENVINFIEGKVKYVIKIDHRTPRIIKFEDFDLIYDREEIKLLSLFGRDDGSMTFKLHQYPDGSGGYSYTEILPFCDYDSAYDKFKELVASGYINEEILAIAKEHNISLDQEKVEKYKNEKISSLEKNIKDLEANITKYKTQIGKVLED